MKYKLIKSENIPKKEKHGIHLNVYPNVGDSGIVYVDTESGHNQEFYDRESTFTYVILEGEGKFYLNDEDVGVSSGDMLSIDPNTRIYYKGKFKMILITTPAWKPENEVETRPSIW
jgi:mannose-6-phosphate isomerase-like protein (cupin superfamily)